MDINGPEKLHEEKKNRKITGTENDFHSPVKWKGKDTEKDIGG